MAGWIRPEGAAFPNSDALPVHSSHHNATRIPGVPPGLGAPLLAAPRNLRPECDFRGGALSDENPFPSSYECDVAQQTVQAPSFHSLIAALRGMTGVEQVQYDYDWIVIGSGFGGSVSALRLAEKGYRVAVLECGRRFRDEDLPRNAWQLSRYFWAPMLGLKGLLRLTPFKDIFILSGSGVGGGSLAYAATLYRAPGVYFQHPQWRDLDDWETRLRPHYDTAERMLGVTEVPFESEADRLLKELGEHLGCADTFQKTRVGIYFGTPKATVTDPYFGGEGPARTGCHRCGACMMVRRQEHACAQLPLFRRKAGSPDPRGANRDRRAAAARRRR